MITREIEEEILTENIYDNNSVEAMLDNDEISPLEAGFMMGYEQADGGEI